MFQVIAAAIVAIGVVILAVVAYASFMQPSPLGTAR
jgi:hypothetical protein